MNIAGKILTLVLWLGMLNTAFGQQPFAYTQFNNNLTPINSAYSLTGGGSGEVTLLARRQWLGMDGAPVSYIFNGYLPIPSINATAGLTVLNDKVAVEGLSEINGFFAKAVTLSDEDYLSVGLNFGIRFYKADYASLSIIDPTVVNVNINERVGNMGFSVMLYNPKKYFVGVSMPRLSFRQLGSGSVESNRYFRNNYFLTGGVLVPVGTDFTFKAATLVNYTANVPLQADVSTVMYANNIGGLGFNYRSNNELAALASVNMNNFRLGYSYQFGFGKTRLAGIDNATHEITLSFRLRKYGIDGDFIPYY